MTSPTPDRDRTDAPAAPWSSRWWLASALFLAVLLALALVLIVMSPGSNNAAPGASGPAPGSSSIAPVGTPTSTGGACPPFTGASTDIPTSPPAVSWGLFQTVAVPSSPQAWPAVVEGDVARCYAHTPTGALVAAVQIGTRYPFADDWETVVERQTYGDGKAALTKARKAYEATAEPVAPAPGELGQVAGFQFVTYTDDLAVIEIVTRFSTGSLQASTVTMRWDDARQDWLYEIAARTAPQKRVSSLTGYVQWGGI